MNKKIGVCIVTYNHEKYIARCIESVLEQDYNGDILIYIGEDNSTDNTRKICIEFQRRIPNKIVLISHNENLGLVRNTFDLFSRMQNDKCNFIAMLDGDDYWCDKQKLSKEIRIFEENKNCGLVHSNIALQYGNKIDLNIRKNIPNGMVWPVKFAIGNCSVVFKTELLKYINPQDYIDREFMSVDYPMYVTLSKYTEFYFLNDITAVWRRGHSSVSNTNDINKQINYLQNGARMWKYLDDLFGIFEATPDGVRQWIDNESFNLTFKYGDYNLANNLRCKFSRNDKLSKIKKFVASNYILFKLYCFIGYLKKLNKSRKFISIEKFRKMQNTSVL